MNETILAQRAQRLQLIRKRQDLFRELEQGSPLDDRLQTLGE